MKRYFSELARHSGLRIESGSPTATVLASPPLASQNARREVRGIEVEEVAFTSSSQPHTTGAVADSTGVESISSEPVRSIPDREHAQRPEHGDTDRYIESKSDAPRIHKPSDKAVEVMTVDLTSLDSSAKERSLPSSELETRVIEHPRVVIAEPSFAGAQTSDSGQIAENFSPPEEGDAISEPERNAAADRHQKRPVQAETEPARRFSRAAEQSETRLEEQIERQFIVRNYLKEISEWISTPASPEEEPDSFISADSVESAEDLARRSVRPNAMLPGRLRADAPEQQDLSLSIGTIKIVVEEPRKEVSAPPAAPAKSEPAFERTTTAPTDLSRYYLNRW